MELKNQFSKITIFFIVASIVFYSSAVPQTQALTPVGSSEGDCFADDAVEEAEKTDTPLS